MSKRHFFCLHLNADIGIGPHSLAIGTNRRIPLVKVLEVNTVHLADNPAELTGLDKMELLATLDHTALGRLGGDDGGFSCFGRSGRLGICGIGGCNRSSRLSFLLLRFFLLDTGADLIYQKKGVSYLCHIE